jgi:histidine phosphotransferase ChpT
MKKENNNLTEVKLAELLCARFSHDLAGPIGAINNGVEFLSEGNTEIIEQATDLIRTSAMQAVSRLQFLRYVYGFIQTGHQVNLEEYRKLIDNFFNYTKSTVVWNFVTPAHKECDARIAKILMNMLLLTSTIVLNSGNIVIDIKENNRFTIHITGKKIFLDDYNYQVLNRELNLVEVNTKNIHIQYFLNLLEQEKLEFKVHKNNDAIVMELGSHSKVS